MGSSVTMVPRDLATLIWLLCSLLVIQSVVCTVHHQQELNNLQIMLNNGNLSGLIPSTPHPESVNCYVEIQMMETVGGRCVRFGRSRMWSCQSGIHLELNHDCERQSRRRERTTRG